MNQINRMEVAEGLCNLLVGKYGDGIVMGGVYGSVARGIDTDWSDLDMLIVSDDKCGVQGQHLIYRGTAVGYMVIKRGELEDLLANPSLESVCGWPFYMGVLNVIKVLCGDASLVETWLDIGRSVPESKFRESLERHLPELILESYGRIFSSRQRGEEDDWYCAVLEVLFEMRDALCLLNNSWVTNDYAQGMRDTFKFPKLPRRYKEIVPVLWQARDIDEAMPLATELVESFSELLNEEGIEVRDFTDLSDIHV